MAASSAPQGYQCEFIDSVPEDFYCKQCSLVARKLTITSCCGESYCKVCIHSTQQDNKPCPGCGMVNFETLQHIKYQKKILTFQVSCSQKKRGCGWCGPLKHLDAHLDPDTGDCEYTDIDCPLKCDKKINKTKINEHITEECVKREYACPHCSSNSIYEIIVGVHRQECSYYPIPCPNSCGVTCVRSSMEEHVSTCSLQEVECDFKDIGCKERFRREDQEAHMKLKSQTHLTMMVTASVKMNKDFQKKLKEQQRQFEEALLAQEREFEKKIETKLQQHERELGAIRRSAERCENLERTCGLGHTFTMYHFSVEKAKDKYDDWKTTPMYTHLCGYKFCIGVDANGCVQTRGESVNVELWVMKGEYDDKLKWPVAARFTIELINHFEGGGENKKVVQTITWRQPDKMYERITGFRALTGFRVDGNSKKYHFIKHSELAYNPATRTQFLRNDALYFDITDITIM